MRSKSLELLAQSTIKSINTYIWPFDAVQEEDLNDHDDRIDTIEIDQVKRLVPALTEQITDFFELARVL